MVLHTKDGVKEFDSHLLKLISNGRDGKNEEALRILDAVDPSKLIDSSGKSLLHWTAALLGNPAITQYLIEKGCDIDAQDNHGYTPLMSAVVEEKEHAMKALIEANANIHICNNNGISPVEYVISRCTLSNRGVVKLFLNKLREECGTDKQLLANRLVKMKCQILIAVLLRDAEITRMMLDQGCSVNVRCCHRIHDTALHEAVLQSDLANVKLLVERGAKINAMGNQDETPLYRYNVWLKDTEERLEVLKFLIRKGALLRFENDTTPMTRLMKDGRKTTVRALLEIREINWRTKYSSGNTALHLACNNQNPGVAEAIRLFHGKDFDIDAINDLGLTALMLAVLHGSVDVVECLLEMGADVNIVGTRESVALHMAYKDMSKFFPKPIGNYHKIVNLLLFYGTQAQYFPTFLDNIHLRNGSPNKAKSVLARIAEMDVQNPTEVSDTVHLNVRKVEKHEDYYLLCKDELEVMKSTKVYGSITLLELLHVISNEKLMKYARNHQFMVAYNRMMMRIFDSMPHYYLNIIRRRVSAAVTAGKLQEEAADVISKIMELNIGPIVGNRVASYLHGFDLKNLCEAFKINSTKGSI